MADEKLERAQRVFTMLCTMLDARNWRYEKNEEKLSIECTVFGEDLPMDLTINVDSGRELIILLSHLPFTISEEKRLETAIATTIVNNRLVDGSFDYNIAEGHMLFRMTSSFVESEIGNELLNYMVAVSLHTIDEYNDKFLLLDKDKLSIEDFISSNW